jgi:hypothetical protein
MWPPYRNAILEVFGAAVSARDAETLTVLLKKIIAHLRKPQPARLTAAEGTNDHAATPRST